MTRGRVSGALIGLLLGALVAVLVHFLSHTLPHTFYVGTYQGFGDSQAAVITPPASVHPSWLPLLPVAPIVGAAVGYLLAWLLGRLGWRLMRDSAAA